MFPYEHLLIPTDGSTSATHAARHGLSLGAALDATVHVLSVTDDTAVGPNVRSTITEKENEQTAADVVDDLISEAEIAGITNTVRHIEHETPVEGILDCIDSNDTHAVVMGTTGRRGTDRILLGSIAEKTVHSAPVPAITVGGGE